MHCTKELTFGERFNQPVNYLPPTVTHRRIWVEVCDKFRDKKEEKGSPFESIFSRTIAGFAFVTLSALFFYHTKQNNQNNQ